MWEHLEYVARLHGRDDWEQDAADLLGHLGLYERADDLPVTFSRGLRQKTALALGLIRPFELLLVDEPFVGLDAAGKAALLELLDEAHGDGARPWSSPPTSSSSCSGCRGASRCATASSPTTAARPRDRRPRTGLSSTCGARSAQPSPPRAVSFALWSGPCSSTPRSAPRPTTPTRSWASSTKRPPTGWEVVSIVPTGGDVTAFLKRSAASGERRVGGHGRGGHRRHRRRRRPGRRRPAGHADQRAGGLGLRPGTTATEEPAAAERLEPGCRRRRRRCGQRVGAHRHDGDRGTGGQHAASPSRRRPPRWRRRRRHRPRPRRRRRGGTPTRRAATRCATGTATSGPSTCRARARRTPTRPWRDAGRPRRSDSIEDVRATSIGHAGILDRDGARVDPLRSVVRAGVLRVLVRLPRNDRLDAELTAAHRASRLPLRLPPARRPPRRGVPGRPRRPRRPPSCCPASRPTSSSAGCARLGFRAVRPHRRRRADATRRPRGRHPRRDLDHRRPRRRLGAGRRRRRRAGS